MEKSEMMKMVAITGGLLVGILSVLIWLLYATRRMQALQNTVLEALDLRPGEAWFRINVVRPAQASWRLWLIGLEGKGILINTQGQVRVVADLPSGPRIDRTFAREELNLQWLGNPSLMSGNMHWITLGSGDTTLRLSADTGMNALASRQATADLCRSIAPDVHLPGIAAKDFALEKNPASLTVMFLFFLLLVYAVADGIVINRNELLGSGPAFRWINGLVLFSLPAYWWLTRNKVPARESMALSMFLCMAMSAAFIPALKRIDHWLAPEAAQVAYRLEPHAILEPIEPGPPRMNYSRWPEYWAQFEVGSTHRFTLTHGPLGLWQIDRTTLDEEMRKFYRSHPAAK